MNGLAVLNPLFVSLLPLALAPVMFHFLFRLKKTRRLYPSLMFFQRIDPKLNARRRVREWLVLVLRILFVACLLLALARPRLLGHGRAGAIAAVLIIDNSGSMSGRGRSELTKLKEAVAAAQSYVSHLHERDSAGVALLVDDPTVILPKGLGSDKPVVGQALDRVVQTEASGNPARALERAIELLQGSSGAHGEIHIFSDLQEEKWNRAPVNLTPPPLGTLIRVHRIATPAASKPNVSILGVQFPERKTLAGRRVLTQVQLANPTSWKAKVQLNWENDAGNRNLQEVEVPAHGEKIVNLSLDAPQPGFRWANLWLQGDSFDADNRASLAFNCDEKRTVLFLGKEADFGLLPMAISPSKEGRLSGLVPVFAGAGTLVQMLEERKPVCVVVTAEALFGAGGPGELNLALSRFVEAGNDLLVVPPIVQNNQALSGPDWIGIGLGRAETNQAGLPLLALEKSADVFNDLRDDRGEIGLRLVKAFQFCPVQAGGQSTSLLGLGDGRVLLAERRVGRGRVFVSGMAFDSAWSTLPLKPGFLALAQSIALIGVEAMSAPLSLVAGEPVAPLGGVAAPIRVESIAGSPLDWKGRGLDFPGFPRAGVYAIRIGKEITHVAVRSSEKEGLSRFLTGERVAALGALPYSVKTLTTPESVSSESERQERSLDLSLPLLLLAILAWFGESWLANQPPIKRRAGPIASTPRPATSRPLPIES